MTDKADLSRRHFLSAATAVTSGVGLAAAAVPFVASFRPSARAQALGAPVEVDISKVEPGALIKVEWRGRVIMIVHRTADMLGRLGSIDGILADPASLESEQPGFADNEHRSLKPEILIVEG
ncbi:MAG TPA: ubiquinol-cytochrome c reductase iron-sulfur subunit N-terminal domain-containing protein, partial [Gammaproteobacteria bacterium]|nr:ubiquinol-cytochrome c reductase iron-sulfur subunit N-terminal domain-containing protein [Gammaproteobacteria bacterium]